MEKMNLNQTMNMFRNAMSVDSIDLVSLENRIQKESRKSGLIISKEIKNNLNLLTAKQTLTKNNLVFLGMLREYEIVKNDIHKEVRANQVVQVIKFFIDYFKEQNKKQTVKANLAIAQGAEKTFKFIEDQFETIESENSFIKRNVNNDHCSNTALECAVNNIVLAKKAIKAMTDIFKEKELSSLRESIAQIYIQKNQNKETNLNCSDLMQVLVERQEV